MAPPIINATVQATVLAATSNILAQVLEAYRASRPVVLDTAPIFNFVIFTLISVPPNFLWQEFLEDTFPGYIVVPAIVDAKKRSPDVEPHEKAAEIVPAKKFSTRNTVIKFSLDQTIACLINTIFFIAAMSALKGLDNQFIIQSVKSDTWPLMLAGYKLWPLVSILSFTVIPVQQRLVFASLVGVGWGIFLSLFVGH